MIADDRAHFLIGLFRHYRAGHLYRAGGVREQPHLYLAAMAFIEAHIAAAVAAGGE